MYFEKTLKKLILNKTKMSTNFVYEVTAATARFNESNYWSNFL